MNLYTSYFDNINKIKVKFRGDVCLVSISRITYDNINVDARYKLLAPSYSLLKEYRHGLIEWDEYTERYNKETLSKLNVANVLNDLSELAGDKSNVVLLCYEEPIKDCHRHLVSDWFMDNGIPCCEI